jgi:hypothetical protein
VEAAWALEQRLRRYYDADVPPVARALEAAFETEVVKSAARPYLADDHTAAERESAEYHKLRAYKITWCMCEWTLTVNIPPLQSLPKPVTPRC